MSPLVRNTWWIALGLIVVGIGPTAILMVVSLFTVNVGLAVYLAMAVLPLALVGAVMVSALMLWTLIVRLRR